MDPIVTSENKGLEHVRPYFPKDNGIPLGYQLSFFCERGARMEPLITEGRGFIIRF